MGDNPARWLTEHWEAGVSLREEGWGLQTPEEAEAWHAREIQWAQDLYRGVKARDPAAVGKLRTLNWITVLKLPKDHPWAGIENNPIYCHNMRLDKVDALIAEWRGATSTLPKLRRTQHMDHAPFEAWYQKRAADAKENARSSREQDRRAAEAEFGCSVPWDWITSARNALPKIHPFRRRGRPRDS